MRLRQAVAWLLTLAVLALAAAAIIIRPAPLRPNPVLTPPPLVHPTVLLPTPVGGHRPGAGGSVPLWVILVGIAVGLGLLAWVLSRIDYRRPRRARSRRRPLETDADYAAVADHLAQDALARRRLLEGTDPRAGVLQAWLDVQAAAARSGLERGDAETSTEFTARVLSRWAVDPRALNDLAAAYREAQFSDHPIGEDVRRRVLAALDVIERAIAQLAVAAEVAP